MKRPVFLSSALVSLSLLFAASAVAQNALEGAVEAKYSLTRAKPDKSDIEKAGAVIVLKKENLVMYSIGSNGRAQVVYKDGKLNPSTMMKFMGCGPTAGFAPCPATITKKVFYNGDKFWLTGVEEQKDGLVLYTLSDPFGDDGTRYAGSIKFPFPKNAPPPPDQLLAQISEVIDVDSAATAAAAAPAAPAPAPSAPPAAALAPIAPPPPPPDQPAAPPPTISLGESKDDVLAGFGAPARIVKLGPKEIDYFKDMKVTFVNGKVTDVQ